mmetsp:Transcript_37197/g.77918  ORF Transcript_37197/g.77918 Transcript_37197/m.77918 type:complete len:355 (-) Transcript_37197:1853-2917(-)
MNTRGSGTTTWYAFEDPKTGREYFHEPISDKTSWVRPTSSSNATQIEKAKGMSGLPQCRTGKETEGKAMDEMDTTKSQRKQGRGWGTAGIITLLSVLLFNTLFLLFLVKFLYENKTLPGQVHDQFKPPVQEHKNISDAIKLSSDDVDAVEIMQEEIIIEAQMDTEILDDDADKEDAGEENVRIVSEPPIVTSSPNDSGGRPIPDDVAELNYERNPQDYESAKQEDESSDVQKEVEYVEEESVLKEVVYVEEESAQKEVVYVEEESVQKEVEYVEEESAQKEVVYVEEESVQKEVVYVEEESAQKYNESKQVLTEKGGKKGLGAVLARKIQRLRTTVASFFYRLLRAGRRLRSGR